ncbi:MAG: hypothetical protein E2O88_12105 [Bacteroidetes bacterium]|nr:MAG: hypothetical protein E2O88_12105 [Bacteroidota bacterium]
MKIFLNKNHKRRAIIGFLLSLPVFMWLMPYGSFDPREIGFWMSIVLALIIEIPGNLLLTNAHKKWGNNSSNE